MEIKSIRHGKNDSRIIQSGIADLYGSKQCKSSIQITAANSGKVKPLVSKYEAV